MKKVSAVMCTYRRFKCVERSINCFINQTYDNKELIIFNTDIDNPYTLSDELSKFNIKIINNNIDYLTNEGYSNVGAIRRDSLQHATGDYYICWDDDDIFLPWFIEQGMNKINESNTLSFKPAKSFFYSGNELRLVQNVLEASIISDINKIREYGFRLETGSEGLGWYTKMRDNNELDENFEHYLPSYCFNWNDGEIMNATHKQSGDINNPDNFNIHKQKSTDYAIDSVRRYSNDEIKLIFEPYYNFLSLNRELFPEDLYHKYIK